MGRGKKRTLSERTVAIGELDALAPGFTAAEAAVHVAALDPEGQIEIKERGPWLYLVVPAPRDYQIVGKYLFFAPDPAKLLPLAALALREHGFHHSKVSRYRNGYPNHALCLYWKDAGRLAEMGALAAAHGLEYGGWKTDAATRAEHGRQD